MMAHGLKLACCSAVIALAAAVATSASAQGPAPAEGKAPPKAAAKPAPQTSRPAAGKEDAPSRSPGDAALRQRIEQLEEQLSDMQVVIGTLESLSRSGGSAAPVSGGDAGRGSGVSDARVDSLETQMRAISDQMEQLAAQVRQLTNRRSEALPPDQPPPAAAPPQRQASVAEPPRQQPGGFGSITVTPGGQDRDPIGSLINAPPQAGTPLPAPVANAGNSKELYETAYGYLLQQDYGAAEVAFEEFMRRHPSDRLAPDAQYWLGEALYVQRRYKPAGQAFLRVIEKYPTSNKVPNSILKLATTLDQLGQKDCALFEELETRHPNAPADVKSKARALKQRVGC